MPEQVGQNQSNTTGSLAAQGYWPARAAKCVDEGKYSQAVEICKAHLTENPGQISGWLIYGRALFLSGQYESAEDQFHYVLSLDPDNLVALKLLADSKFNAGDSMAATAYYRRVLEIDPFCQGLKCDLTVKPKETTRTISLVRPSEPARPKPTGPLRSIPFYTETMGDLYFNQGHARLAAEVFRHLIEHNRNPRLVQKLTESEARIKEKGN